MSHELCRLQFAGRRVGPAVAGLALVALWLGAPSTASAAVVALQQGGFTIYGNVSLPNGEQAARVKVKIEGLNGLNRETQTDDQGRYGFYQVPGGRYRLTVINPNDPTQLTDRVEADTSRSFASRVQVHLYLRTAPPTAKAAKPGVISAAEAAQQVPKNARKAYEQGLKLQKENRPEQALAQFDQAIELYPGYFQALTERANLLMQRNQLAEAEAGFERALALNSKYPPALRGIGYCQLQQKKFPAALINLEKAFSLEPEVAPTLLLLGYANLSLNRHAEARECLQQALKLGPESAARAHVYLGEIFSREGKYKEAADEIRRYLKLKPEAPDAARLKELEAQWRARSGKAQNQP